MKTLSTGRRSFLAETASPLIGQYIDELQKLHEHIRMNAPSPAGPVSRPFAHDPNWMYRVLNAVWERQQPWSEMLTLVSSTIDSAKRLAFSPLTGEQVAEEIAAHRRIIDKAMAKLGASVNGAN